MSDSIIEMKSGAPRLNGKAVRDSGVELLRILLMLQVVFLHLCAYGNYSNLARAEESDLSAFDTMLYWVTWFMNRDPVYTYVLLTGFFLVSSGAGFSASAVGKRVLKIYLPMFFYSVGILLVVRLLGRFDYPEESVLPCYFPFLSRQWYFMSLYIILLLLSPFLNRLANQISKRQYLYLLAVLFFIFSLWDILAQIEPINQVVQVDKVVSTEQGKGLYGFLMMYFIGGYLRLHVKGYRRPQFRYLLSFVLLGLINVALVQFWPEYIGAPADANSNPFSVLQCVCLLLFFRDLHFHSKAVNWVAASSLGVYMIHEHPYVRDILWNDIFAKAHSPTFYDGWAYPFLIVGITLSVYIGCASIDKIRVLFFNLIGMGLRKLLPKKRGETAE